jgi:hypothetical protein
MQLVAYGDPVARIYGLVGCLIALYAGWRRQISVWIDFGDVKHLFQLGVEAIIVQLHREDARPRQGCGHPRSRLPYCVPSAGQNARPGVSVDRERSSLALSQHLGVAEAARLAIMLTDRRRGRLAQDAGTARQSVGVPVAAVSPAYDLPLDPQVPQASFWQWLERPFIGRDLVSLAPYRPDDMLTSLSLPAPTPGQNNHDVLSERLELSAAEPERLERARLIGTCAATWAH